MALFHRVEDSFAVLLKSGVYRQSELFERNDFLYAAHGTGFVKLQQNGHTTVPEILWDSIDGIKYRSEWNGLVKR